LHRALTNLVAVIPRSAATKNLSFPAMSFAERFFAPLRMTSPQSPHTETIGHVIVDDAHGLHPGVDDHRADELEAAPAQFRGNPYRERRLGRNLLPFVANRLSPGERPGEVAEILSCFPHRQILTRAVYRSL